MKKRFKKIIRRAVKKIAIRKPAVKAPRPETKKMKTSLGSGELKAYKEQLLNLKEETLNQINDISKDTLMKSQKEMSGDISGYGIHMADVATDNYEREFNLGLVSDEHRMLFEIDDAIKRIEDKTYGLCLICKKAIAKIRLKAIPHAKYCKKCQESLEKAENKR